MPRVPRPARHLPRRLQPPKHVHLARAVCHGPHALDEPARLQRLEHPRDRGLLQVCPCAELLGPDADVPGGLDRLVDEDLLGGEALEAGAVAGGGGLEDLAAVGGPVGAEGVLFFFPSSKGGGAECERPRGEEKVGGGGGKGTKNQVSSPFFSFFFSSSYRGKELVDRCDEIDLRERFESRKHVGGGGSLRNVCLFVFVFVCRG